MLIDGVRTYDDIRPDLFEQLVDGDDVAGPGDQAQEHTHGARLDLDCTLTARDQIELRLDTPLADLHGLWQRGHEGFLPSGPENPGALSMPVSA